jgi:hypothetical protein
MAREDMCPSYGFFGAGEPSMEQVTGPLWLTYDGFQKTLEIDVEQRGHRFDVVNLRPARLCI